MPTDISLIGQSTVITFPSGKKKAFTSGRASFQFDDDSNLELQVQTPRGVFTQEIPLSQLTVSGVAPASEAAAITALAMVFNSPAGTGLKTRQVLVSNVPLSHTGNTTETTVFTRTIPGGSIGVNGRFLIDMLVSASANTANNKVVRVKFNGTQVFIETHTSRLSGRNFWLIANRGVLTSQIASAQYGSGVSGNSQANQAFSFNTANDITVTVTITNAVAGETTTIESFTITAVN